MPMFDLACTQAVHLQMQKPPDVTIRGRVI